MCEFSPHSCDAGLLNGKFARAYGARKTAVCLVEGAQQNYQIFNSQTAVEENFCFDVDVGRLIMGPQNI